MEKDKILSSETMIELFSKDGIERMDFENKLFLEAKKNGLHSQLKKTIKEFEKLMKEKINISDNKSVLPKSKYSIENYDFGKYICNKNGITDTKSELKFSYMPIVPVERYINNQTGKEKVKIIFYRENKWEEKIVDRSQLAINQKLLLLSDDGLDVNSENVRYYIHYFNDILSLNDVKKLSSVSHLGWSDKNFIPYDTSGIFDGADEFRQVYAAVSSKGDYNKWKKVVSKMRENKQVRIIMATTFASPLIENLNISPFAVNVWSAMSGSGKTLSCMVAMSAWGDPNQGSLRFSSNSTQNFCIAVASFLRNITCYFDELQIIKNNKSFDSNSLIMDLCNGTEKGRLSKNSQAKDVKSWFNTFLFTNNDKMVTDNAGEQVYNRVIDLEITEKITSNGRPIADVIKNNYGFAGKDFMNYVKKVGFDSIRERYSRVYDKILQDTNSTDKQAASLAILLLADKLAVECLFPEEKQLEISDIEQYVNDKNEIRTSMKAKEYIINIIDVNLKKFEEGYNYLESWGIKTDYYCLINSEILKRELKKGGFEFDTVKKDWADDGFLEKNSQERYLHNTTANSKKGTYIKLKL